MATPIESDPIWAKEYTNSTDIIWYFPIIENKLTEATRHLLETYSNIPPAEVLPHVNTIVSYLAEFVCSLYSSLYLQRDKAWAIRSYMCTGQGLFLDPSMPRHPSYNTILERLRKGATLVDVGTFIGQDLRRLAVDGAPSTDMYAIDIVNHWDIGFDMFRDRDKFHAHYVEVDILHPSSTLQELDGKVDIVWITHVLHQWTWEGQIMATRNLVSLSRLGTLVAGFQVGADVARHQGPTKLMKGESFLHDPVSFAKMWDQVGEETASRWRTEVKYRTLGSMGWGDEDLPGDKRVLEFIVERVE